MFLNIQLACLKCNASVHPEPRSNSLNNRKNSLNFVVKFNNIPRIKQVVPHIKKIIN